MVYSERNTPFDHEFFTRSLKDSFITCKQMLTGGWFVYIPFIIYIGLYIVTCVMARKRIFINKRVALIIIGLSLLSTFTCVYAIPSSQLFKQTAAYYLTCNKFSFWLADSYTYFKNKGKKDVELTDI